jgi:hypothetical protein
MGWLFLFRMSIFMEYNTILELIRTHIIYGVTISNKEHIKPSDKLLLGLYDEKYGWFSGYPFNKFLADVYYFIGSLKHEDGIQQLIHHYYLQNGRVDARTTANRIKKFINFCEPSNPCR